MFHIKSVITKRIKDWGDYKDINAEDICGEARKILNQKNTEGIEVLFYKDTTIYLKCRNSILASELRLNQEEIKKKLNSVFAKEVVKKIVIKG